MARTALKWTLDDLAEASDVGRQAIIKLEAGGNVTPENGKVMLSAPLCEGIAFENGAARARITNLRRN